VGLTGAEKEFKKGIELNPNSATAHHWYGELSCEYGSLSRKGCDETKRAQQLDRSH
jgi:hypothetical protein